MVGSLSVFVWVYLFERGDAFGEIRAWTSVLICELASYCLLM
jgi:hypothetical protein